MSNAVKNATILLVEDDQTSAFVYQEYLLTEGYEVHHEETGKGALASLQKNMPNVVLLDLELPDMNGMDILAHINTEQYPCSVVIISGHGSVDTAIKAMRYNALDFLEKPFDAKRLLVTVRNALEHDQLKRIVSTYRENFDRTKFHGFIGASLPMQKIYRIIESAAPSTATVFITGESGTGKEVGAEAIHQESKRRGQAFVPLNCAAIPKDLMESEIFGHVKGAFTGAYNTRQGAASQADGGTLFLDEIGDMDLELQSKLLRFIQTGMIQKVGATKQEKVDIRLICATNRDPLEEVKNGRFREDLYYRLNVIPIELPPLREREHDILLIARNFLETYSKRENKSFQKFSTEVESLFLQYEWPGNVRQLQNTVQNVVVLHDGDAVTLEMLPKPFDRELFKAESPVPTPPPTAPVQDTKMDLSQIRPMWQIEKEVIEHAMNLCDNNVPKVSALLEMSPATIYRRLQQWKEMED